MSPAFPAFSTVPETLHPRFTQTELLSRVRLRMSESIRGTTKQAGRVILRTASGRRRLVLTPVQAALLSELFSTPRTVPDALARLLGKRDEPGATELPCPPLSEFYELV